MLAELDVLYATNADRFRLVRVCVLMVSGGNGRALQRAG